MITLTQIKLIAGAGVILLAVWFGHHYAALKYDARIAEQAKAVAELQAKQTEQTVKVVTKYVDRVREVKVQSDAVIKEVPIYVSQTADAQCVIPVGFVRIHDEAATGVPNATGTAHESASGIALSAVASTVAENYGTCRETAEQLRSLQDWIRATHGQEVQKY